MRDKWAVAYQKLKAERSKPRKKPVRFLVCNKCGLFSRPWPMTPSHRRDWDEHHFYYCKKPAKSIAA